MAEPLRVHFKMGRRAAYGRAAELLARVGLPKPEERLNDYPHQFSGGMRQRVMIAMALACEPKLLIADEPTTALDVTIQAQILELIGEFASELGTAVLLITHNFGVAATVCDRIQVMYAGQIVESGTVAELFESSSMPYTWGLLEAVPDLGMPEGQRLTYIEGSPPSFTALAPGCRFEPRCAFGEALCVEVEPALTERSPQHEARCHGTDVAGWLA